VVTVSEDVLAETVRIWSQRTDGILTSEDARAIIENVAGVVAVLDAWAADGGHAEPEVE
jgi:hypothetical protein